MNAIVAQPPSSSIIAALRTDFQKLQPQLALALPEHVKPERFIRIVLTAVQGNPNLQKCDRTSLFAACMKAAQDGLLPDGREAFLNCYFSKRDNRFIASYQPMVGGILKKIRQSGELKQLSAEIVREGDEFVHYLDETGEHFKHVTAEGNGDARIRYVYAAAWTKDGGFYFRKMTPEHIEKIRAVSRAKDDGPWVDWWGEMAKKTVIRNLSKLLPMSAEVEQVIHRDDELYDYETPSEATTNVKAGSLRERLLAQKSRETNQEVLTEEPVQQGNEIETSPDFETEQPPAKYVELLEAILNAPNATVVKTIHPKLDSVPEPWQSEIRKAHTKRLAELVAPKTN